MDINAAAFTRIIIVRHHVEFPGTYRERRHALQGREFEVEHIERRLAVFDID